MLLPDSLKFFTFSFLWGCLREGLFTIGLSDDCFQAMGYIQIDSHCHAQRENDHLIWGEEGIFFHYSRLAKLGGVFSFPWSTLQGSSVESRGLKS